MVRVVRFEALVAVDRSAGRGGSVRFRVLVDGVEKYASEIVRGGEVPVPISVELSGTKRLELIVDHADRGDALDRADWLDARLILESGKPKAESGKWEVKANRGVIIKNSRRLTASGMERVE